jgi:hypothetical protein
MHCGAVTRNAMQLLTGSVAPSTAMAMYLQHLMLTLYGCSYTMIHHSDAVGVSSVCRRTLHSTSRMSYLCIAGAPVVVEC